jgi:hypothetical protein
VPTIAHPVPGVTDSRGRHMPSREVFAFLGPEPMQGPSRTDEKPAPMDDSATSGNARSSERITLFRRWRKDPNLVPDCTLRGGNPTVPHVLSPATGQRLAFGAKTT